MVLGLCGYALGCPTSNDRTTRSRRRKVLAFEILATASRVVELPQAVARAETGPKGRGTATAARWFLRVTTSVEGRPPADVVEELEVLVDRTDSR
jgi:hypothetical protein